MIREKTHPCASVQLPPLRSVGLRRVSCFLIKAARMVSVKICELWAKYSRAACPHSTSPHSHISHTTFHIPTSNIPHSQHSSPQSTRFFRRAPPRVQIRHSQRIFATCYHSAAYRLNVTVLRSPLGLPHHETPSFASRSLPFRSSIPYLSHLDP